MPRRCWKSWRRADHPQHSTTSLPAYLPMLRLFVSARVAEPGYELQQPHWDKQAGASGGVGRERRAAYLAENVPRKISPLESFTSSILPLAARIGGMRVPVALSATMVAL